jgi:hypothetical protein
MRKPLVENARLNRERHLGRQDLAFQSSERTQRKGTEPEGKRQCRHRADRSDKANGQQQAPQADARSMERHNFTVGREPAKADQHPDENGHRNREDQHGRQGTQKQKRDGGRPSGVTYHDFHQVYELRNEKYKGEYG